MTEPEATALHEAAHAVVARLVHARILSVTMDPPLATTNLPRTSLGYRKDAVIDMAGCIGENVQPQAHFRDEINALANCQRVIKIRKGRRGKFSDVVELKRNLRQVSRRMVRENRREIEAVAKALKAKGSLTEAEVDAAIFQARLEKIDVAYDFQFNLRDRRPRREASTRAAAEAQA